MNDSRFTPGNNSPVDTTAARTPILNKSATARQSFIRCKYCLIVSDRIARPIANKNRACHPVFAKLAAAAYDLR